MSDHDHHVPGNGGSPKRFKLSWVFFGFLAVAGFFLLAEHRAHLTGALPFVLLAFCSLMHFFHGGHGGHGGHQRTDGSRKESSGRGAPPRSDRADASAGEDRRSPPSSAPHRH